MSGTIGLVMIVKNEERALPRLAASLGGQLDHWTIVDTGSTDSTVEVVHEAFGALPGELIEDTWRGFGPSRNVALGAARGHTDWLLTLDADETVEGNLRGALENADADAIEAQQQFDTLRFWMPYLLRAEAPWSWKGRTHEFLTLGELEARMSRTESFQVVHHADGTNRAEKFERDLRLLHADLEEEPDDPRTTFYLARTYEDLGRTDAAADAYRRRIELDGWDEETWYARWHLGSCLLALEKHDEGAGVLLGAWGDRPWRAEPLCSLAEHYRLRGRWQLCWEIGRLGALHTAARPDGRGQPPSADRLFVHEDVYRWRLAYERSICAWYVGERSTGRRLCDYLLGQELPSAIRESVLANRRYYA